MSDAMIEQSAERLFSGNVDKALLERFEAGAFPQPLWNLVVESGFSVALASEAGGGIGQCWSDCYPILRGLGYWQVPLPLSETMIGAQLLSLAGIEIPDGPMTVIEQPMQPGLSVTGSGASLRLSGRATRVPWARHCGWAVVSLGATGIALVDLRDNARVSITPHADHARVPSDTLGFDGAAAVATAVAPLPALAAPVWTLGAVARSMMMVGALEWLLAQSVQYANDRIQFGKPIGKNQAIQQQLALLAGDVAAARVAALVAGADAPSSTAPGCDSTVFSAAVAKIRCAEAATRGTAISHQVHGAIGFTHEHMLHFATRRLWAWREEFGSDGWWAERLGRAMIDGGAAAFWPGLTQRRFDTDIGTV